VSEVESDATELADVTMLRAQHRVGRVLRGKWHLDALLGVGGMAAVYAATHRNGKRAAIKVLHPELSIHGHVPLAVPERGLRREQGRSSRRRAGA